MTAQLQRKKAPSWIRFACLPLAAAAVFALQTLLARLGVWAAGQMNYQAFDPDGAFAWISVHHVVQGLATLMLMLVLTRVFRLDFHLGSGNRRLGFVIVAWFAVLVLIYQFTMWFALDALHLAKTFGYPVNARNVLGVLFFQLLLSGTCEELLFRALPIALLLMLVPKRLSLFRGRVVISVSAIAAAVLFSLAHVNWAFHPFRLNYDILQLLYALALGLVQGWAYEKTGSVLYPMMMHGISNVWVVVLNLVMPVLF